MPTITSSRTIFFLRALAGFGHPTAKIAASVGAHPKTVKRLVSEYGPITVQPLAAVLDAPLTHYWIGYLHNLPRSTLLSNPDRTVALIPKKALDSFNLFLETSLQPGRGGGTSVSTSQDPTLVFASTENENLFLALEKAKHFSSAYARSGTFSPSISPVGLSGDLPAYLHSKHYWRGAVDSCEAVRGFAGGTLLMPVALTVEFETDNGIPYVEAFLKFCSQEMARARLTKKQVPIRTLASIEFETRKRGPKARAGSFGIPVAEGNWASCMIRGIAAELIVEKLYRGVESEVKRTYPGLAGKEFPCAESIGQMAELWKLSHTC